MIDLRLGRWQDTMADVECDTLITDPPYSARTHGLRDSTEGPYALLRRTLEYEHVDPAYCSAFVEAWAPRVRRWWVIFGDFTTTRYWLDALDSAGLLTFVPVIWAKVGAAPRFSGDGPASQVEYLTVARTKGLWATKPPWGSLPGWYTGTGGGRNATRDDGRPVVEGADAPLGQKPLHLMRALVRDYSRPGWTIADPHAGSGTTLVAARAEGRHCIGSEMDPNTFAIAQKRLAQPYARDLFVRESA